MSVDQGVRGHVAPDRGDRSQPSRLQRNYAVLHLLLEKLRFAAGSERVATLDAQRLAEDFLGDSIYSNIVAVGCAWQRFPR